MNLSNNNSIRLLCSSPHENTGGILDVCSSYLVKNTQTGAVTGFRFAVILHYFFLWTNSSKKTGHHWTHRRWLPRQRNTSPETPSELVYPTAKLQTPVAAMIVNI